VAFKRKVELSRLEPDGNRTLQYIDVTSLPLNGQSDNDVILQNFDKIHVYSLLDQIPQQVVKVFGEVKNPGEYTLEKNMRVSDLILRAGNVKRNAYLLEAEVAKVDPNKPVKSVRVNLQQVLDGSDPSQNILLEADDFVFVRQIPKWKVGPAVTLRGEVTFPGIYVIVEDSTLLSEIIAQAGGLTTDAYVREAKLIRMREPLVEDKEFERLKTMMRDEMTDLEYEYYVMKQNTSELREIVVDFYKLLRTGDRSEDVVLEDGDVIDIPKKPQVVLVSGCVSQPGGIVFQEKANLRYYIQKAGGFSWDADAKRTKVIKATGEIKDDEDVDTLIPGDRIWVPRKPDRNFWLTFRDVILTAGQMATIYLVIQNAIQKN
jgi:protein involved in polysaccharide export with SLBB domain